MPSIVLSNPSVKNKGLLVGNTQLLTGCTINGQVYKMAFGAGGGNGSAMIEYDINVSGGTITAGSKSLVGATPSIPTYVLTIINSGTDTSPLHGGFSMFINLDGGGRSNLLNFHPGQWDRANIDATFSRLGGTFAGNHALGFEQCGVGTDNNGDVWQQEAGLEVSKDIPDGNHKLVIAMAGAPKTQFALTF